MGVAPRTDGAHHHLHLPLTEAEARRLAVGDAVWLDGDIVSSAGLPTFERLVSHLDAGQALPIDLQDGVLFHLGSYSRDAAAGMEVLYANPTTSTRFNPYMPRLIRDLRLHAVGGKGGLDAACVRAMADAGCVYLSFLGGGATLISQAIKEVKQVAWDDLIAHYRLVQMRVESLGPLIVGIDANGNSVYDDLQESARDRLPAILEEMRNAR